MDMPPAGWYPDPYGAAGLLRWWDGQAWTEHTQASEGQAGQASPGGTSGSAPVTALDMPPVTSLDLPATGLAISGQTPPPVADTAFDLPAFGSGFEPPDNSTRVYSAQDYSGYARAMRERQIRRRWVMSGLAVVTVALVAIMAVVLLKIGKQQSPAPAALSHTPTPRHAPSATPSPTSSPTPSPTPSTSLISDNSSGLAYIQLGSPWQPQCPQVLNQQSPFSWTAGESAVAGQPVINGQQSSWYGNACSGTLPQQFGYNGVQDLANTTANVAQTIENTYYNRLQHTVTQQLSQPLQVSGHAAWEVTYLITYTDPSGQGLSWSTEQGAVVLVDHGTGASPAVFYASVPANLGEQNVSSLLSSLTMPASSASPGASGSPGASPGPGGPPAGGPPGGGPPGNGGGNDGGNGAGN
jgi:hypothetical protein